MYCETRTKLSVKSAVSSTTVYSGRWNSQPSGRRWRVLEPVLNSKKTASGDCVSTNARPSMESAVMSANYTHEVFQATASVAALSAGTPASEAHANTRFMSLSCMHAADVMDGGYALPTHRMCDTSVA